MSLGGAVACEVRLSGHLTAEVLEAALAPVSAKLVARSEPILLLVDCTAMTGYDLAARERFVAWNREHRARITGVGIVTSNVVWRMIISAMSLAASQSMCAFDHVDAGRLWLERGTRL